MKKFALLLVALASLTLVQAAQAAPAEGAAPTTPAVTTAAEGLSTVFTNKAGLAIGVGIGAGIIVFGAAKGIGNIGASAVESIARQPEAGGRIFTAMLLSAALIEGFTFFALLIQFTLK